MLYEDYLKTDHWANLKIEAFEQYGKKCCICHENKTLHVHHLWYCVNYDWESTQVEQLRVLCHACHIGFHNETEILFIDPTLALKAFKLFKKKTEEKFVYKQGNEIEDYKNRKKKFQPNISKIKCKKRKTKSRRLSRKEKILKLPDLISKEFQISAGEFNKIYWGLSQRYDDIAKYFNITRKQVAHLKRIMKQKKLLKKHLLS